MTAPIQAEPEEVRQKGAVEIDLKDLDIDLKDPLGHGGFCMVYKAHFKHENSCDSEDDDGNSKRTIYALKKLKTGVRKAQMARTQLEQEGEFLACLKHSNIIFLVGQGFDISNNSPFLLMEMLVDTLEHYVEKWQRKSTSYFSPYYTPADQVRARLRQVVLGICDGMSYLHSNNIVFRDLKPDNVGFSATGQIKLFDFGLAAKLLPPHYKCAQQAGTVRYLAPEIARGKAYDEKADVYSFSILLWQIITGKLPFERELGADNGYKVAAQVKFLAPDKRTPVQFVQAEQLQALLKELWHPFPFKRPSFDETITALKDFLGPTPEDTEPAIFKPKQVSKAEAPEQVPLRPGRPHEPDPLVWWSA